MADSIEEESMLVPMLIMGGILIFAMYACCGPAADPSKERPHSESSTRKAMGAHDE